MYTKTKIINGTSEVYKTEGAFGNLPKKVLPADSKIRFSLKLLDNFFTTVRSRNRRHAVEACYIYMK